MKDWKEFENWTKEYLSFDKAKLTPGSGNAKSEEDVVGLSVLAQCKCSGNKNVSIQEEDLQRLEQSANMLDKVPLFFSQSKSRKILSLLVDNYEENSKSCVKLLSLLSSLETINYIIDHNNVTTQAGVDECHHLAIRAEKLWSEISGNIRKNLRIISTKIDSKYDDITMGNLFE